MWSMKGYLRQQIEPTHVRKNKTEQVNIGIDLMNEFQSLKPSRSSSDKHEFGIGFYEPGEMRQKCGMIFNNSNGDRHD